jgi:hypothetical protein
MRVANLNWALSISVNLTITNSSAAPRSSQPRGQFRALKNDAHQLC